MNFTTHQNTTACGVFCGVLTLAKFTTYLSLSGNTYLCRYYDHSVDVVWYLLQEMVSLAQGPIPAAPLPRLWTRCTCSQAQGSTTSYTVGFCIHFTKCLSLCAFLRILVHEGH